ncbi:glycoside hydrolase family 130 protein [Micromonospora sp. C32]|uniref:glycoside hydrolase family 130 protein n=1 Tax=unclassified Micromonospora TaxID=2617518 RepID=UPI001B39B688|nr:MULTISPECIES: glycoside hydrolase family 130 protein [unclassified Micromonospora]MBQ1044144.1 glycoside hydrolase family 130 protein [Micromonospora sp. C72]MBQ1058296.1 glycoside hydrolase family 130 protein [Micromonospora sp. C32]
MTEALAVRHGATLTPDPRRVVVKLFVPGEDAALVRSRAAALIARVAHLDDEETGRLLRDTFDRFGSRHRDLDGTFHHHYDLVRHRIARARDLPPTTRLLIGAYFSHEYAVEAAALCNPSMVIHPDQGGLDAGQMRVAISLRQIGEGHLSSIGFASAVLGPGRRLIVAARSGPPVIGQRIAVRHRRDLLAAGLSEVDCDNEITATVLDALPERYDEATFERVLGDLPPDLLSRSTGPNTLEHVRRTNAASYATTFPTDTALHQRVLWPAVPAESNGMEDARLVRFVDDSGPVYRATYTAYDGRHIATRALASTDLRRFESTPMRGPGVRNKGVALFPRPVGGRHLALCRADGETIGLTRLDGENRWQEPVPLHAPQDSWELIQVGNCGSPIETDAGWLVLTHGVGPMRRYAIGALLLDLHRPERVLARLPGALLSPDEADRDGYVPNVVYSCGGLVHAGELWLPYGASDARVGFATVSVAALLDAMARSPYRAAAPAAE